MTTDYKNDIEVLSAVAGAFLIMAFWIWRRESAARHWSRVSGMVVTSRLASNRTPSELARSNWPQDRAVIEYEFSYQGQSFRSSHRRIGNFSIGAGTDTLAVLSRYPVGAPVTVLVNPRDPKKSVLELGASLCLVPFAFGMFSLFLTIILVMIELAKR